MASHKNFITLVVAFVAIIINNHDVIAKPPSKIVGGNLIEIFEYPSIVSLRYTNSHICGGTLISKNKVLTAAHCLTKHNTTTNELTVTPIKYITIGTGSRYSMIMENIHKVKKFDIHSDYTGKQPSYSHDIAIITLENDIKEDSTHKIISLPKKDVEIGSKGFVAGWGSQKEYGRASAVLQSAPMTIITNDKCQSQISTKILPGHVCAFHKLGVGFCDGDSGGPLVINGEIVGVVSMSLDCGKGFPDIYTRVYSYLNWIRGKM